MGHEFKSVRRGEAEPAGHAARRRRLPHLIDAANFFQRSIVGLSALIIAGAVLGLIYFFGFQTGERQFFPYGFLAKVDNKLQETFFPQTVDDSPTEGAMPSHLIRLVAEVGEVDMGRGNISNPIAQNGGGMTSFGDDVLLLGYSGEIIAASSASTIRKTGIVAPDNNRDAYEALADDPDWEAYTFRPGYVRYNDVLHFDTDGARGLIASYTEFHPEDLCYTNTLARLDIPTSVASIDEVKAGPEDWRILHRTTPCLPFKDRYLALEGHMAGGRLEFEAPSTLYVANGDYHYDGMRSEGAGIAQDPDGDYGKVLAVDIGTGQARHFTTGHRNPQGIVAAPDGRLFVAEHGPRGGDEINILRDGLNYGWPLESYGTTYGAGTQMPNSVSFGRHETFEPPIYSWVPSVATSGLAYIDGFHPAWDGDLLVAALIDESIFRVRLEGDRAIYAERIKFGQRIRDIHQHSDGQIVIWTDTQHMIFLRGEDRSNLDEIYASYVEEERVNERLATTVRAKLQQCAECHSFDAGDHEKAPSLARIHGDEIASTGFDGYSDALKRRGGTWTSDALTAFLVNPQGFAPGSVMPQQEFEDREIEVIVGFLEELDLQF